MVNFLSLLKKLSVRKVLVVGDVILDTYTIGKAKRISPEAPVPIVNVFEVDHKPGGAANVALNLVAMGISTQILGRIGNDTDGHLLQEKLKQEGITVEGLMTQTNYKTPVKNRIIAENQQIVRIDCEEITSIPEIFEDQIIEMLPALLNEVDLVAISDYGKGFLSKTLLSSLIEAANEKQIPVIVDPKGTDFVKYRGADLIKPNLSEAYAAANLPLDTPLESVAQNLLEQVKSKAVMITKASEGISVFYPEGLREDFPATIREVKDVTGAGDTVLATVTCALANQLSYAEAAQLANISAGISLEKLGCAVVTLADLSKRILDLHGQAKVIDETTFFAIKQAINDSSYVVLNLSLAEGLTTEMYQSIKEISSLENTFLIVYINDEYPSEHFVELLASIKEIDYIILDKEVLDKFQQLSLKVTK